MVMSPESCTCPFVGQDVSMAGSCGAGSILFLSILQNFIRGRCDLADPCNRVHSRLTIDEEYDFVVIGGGTAGAVVAGRLSENPNFKILLLEAGGDEPIASSVPSFYRSYWDNPETDWEYRSQPQPDVCQDQGGRGCKWPRGKMLGGTSVINGMMYHRGHAADYEDWVRLGAAGWSWEENLPYFLKSERNKQVGELVSAEHHATDGPMAVQQFKYRPELAEDLLQAVQQAGINLTLDMNDPDHADGITIAQTLNDGGSRVTTARAFLRPAAGRENLHVLLHAHVARVVLENDKVTAVEFYHQERFKRVRVAKEAIMCAGALNTPQLLMLSGIGPKETLEQHEIPVHVDLPGVGQNLQNHIGVNLYFLLDNATNSQDLDWAVAMQYMLSRDGIMSSTGITQVTGLLYSSYADVKRQQPDLQLFFNGLYAECSSTGAVGEPKNAADPLAPKEISITGLTVLPRSIGHVTIKSYNPFDKPLLYPNFLADPIDMELVKEAARIVYKIVDSDILRNKWGIRSNPAYTKNCLSAGPERSDAYLECIIRLYTDPQNHQCGTAAIGSVVDPRLRVYNVSGLRVIDASVMPQVPSGNPMAPVIMVAERGADFIKEDWSS